MEYASYRCWNRCSYPPNNSMIWEPTYCSIQLDIVKSGVFANKVLVSELLLRIPVRGSAGGCGHRIISVAVFRLASISAGNIGIRSGLRVRTVPLAGSAPPRQVSSWGPRGILRGPSWCMLIILAQVRNASSSDEGRSVSWESLGGSLPLPSGRKSCGVSSPFG